MALKIKAKNNQYRKSGTGRPVFNYTITGTAEELENYKKAQGVNYKENENNEPLFFSTSPLAIGADLVANQAGTAYGVRTNLEDVAVEREMLVEKEMAKNDAIRRILGLSDAEYKAKMMKKMFGDD